jgi:hypothetical protein
MEYDKGLPAAEAYALYDRPPCKCHGESQFWQKSEGFRCAVRRREWERGWKREQRTKNTPYAERQRVLNNALRREQRANNTPQAARHRALVRERAATLIERGLCSKCGRQPLATADAWFCNECLDKKVSPLNLLKNRRRNALRRMVERAERRAA